ncbi:MAG: HAD family phosphatase [Lachnospiraceae bacterium]|nr:HAD family phosphatase [Lachnospiraceae bacterium]
MEQKALFTDLDGTLLNDAKEVTEGNRLAIEEMRRQGHLLVVTTGRPLVSAIAQAEKLGLSGPGSVLIAYNGGILYDLGRHAVIDRVSIPLPTVYALFDEANARGLYIQTYSEERVLIEEHSDHKIAGYYCGRIGMQYDVIPDIRSLAREPEKLLLIDLVTRSKLNRFIEEIGPSYEGRLDLFYSSQYYLEVVPCGVNKGNALLRLADRLGIRPENTVAAGDEANDIPMLLAARYGVAMRNSAPDVLAKARYVTTLDNNHDGVAEIIRDYILSPEHPV